MMAMANGRLWAVVGWRAGETLDNHVYSSAERRPRDLSMHVLPDISEFTKDKVAGSHSTVL